MAKRKATGDPKLVLDKDSMEDYSKKAKMWASQVVNLLWNKMDLTPLDSLASQHEIKGQWVGAYPSPEINSRPRNTVPWQHSELGQGRPLSVRGIEAIKTESSKPYQLGPYVKTSAHSSPQDSSLQNHSEPEGLIFDDEAPFQRELSSSIAHRPLEQSVRNGNVPDRFHQDNLLRARSRIYAGKAQRTSSLLQSKYNKEESLARQRLLDRQTTAIPRSDPGRLRAALDSTIGLLRTDKSRDTLDTRRNSLTSTQDDVERHRRIRAFNMSSGSDLEPAAPRWTPRTPAFLRTKYQGNREPSWMQNLRTLLKNNLPSIEKQQRPPGHQAVIDEHDRIEKELADRQKSIENQFKPLNKEDTQRIQMALADGHGQVVEGFNVALLKKDIHTLRPGEWLNDEVINFYGNLIMARSKESDSLPKVHVFSTFFYKTLSENGYDKVRRWTKKVNVFAMDYLLIPIHCSGNHWTSAVIDMKNKRIEYYDSLLGNNPKCFLILRNYLEKECQDKLKKPFDFQGWENDCPKDIPKQQNGFDCGVFTCTFIENKSRGIDSFEFSQKNMPYLRQRMVLSLINKAL